MNIGFDNPVVTIVDAVKEINKGKRDSEKYHDDTLERMNRYTCDNQRGMLGDKLRIVEPLVRVAGRCLEKKFCE